MGINVNYSPVGIAGQVAAQTGANQGKNASLQDAMALQGMAQRERFFNKDMQNQIWNTQFRTAAGIYQQGMGIKANQQNLAAQLQNRNRMAMFDAQQRQQAMQFQRASRAEALHMEESMRNRLANQDWLRHQEQGRVEDERTKKMFEYQYSQQQKRQMAELQSKIAMVNENPDMRPEERADAIQQLQNQFLGIEPFIQPAEQPPWPEGRAPGQLWEDRGYLWATEVDANKNIKLKNHGPVMQDDTRPDQNTPYRRGYGLYQKGPDGKEFAIVEPPKIDLEKMREKAYEETLQTMMSEAEAFAEKQQAQGNNDPGDQPGVDMRRVRAEALKAFRESVREIMEVQEMLIQMQLGSEGPQPTGLDTSMMNPGLGMIPTGNTSNMVPIGNITGQGPQRDAQDILDAIGGNDYNGYGNAENAMDAMDYAEKDLIQGLAGDLLKGQ